MSRLPLKFLGGLSCLAALVVALYLSTRTHVTLIADGAPRRVATHAESVAGALRDANVTLGPEDVVTPPLEARLAPDIVIAVDRAPLVRVEADGRTHLIRTRSTSPTDILALLDLRLGPGDELWADGRRVEGGTWPEPPQQIAVRRALTVSVVVDAQPAVHLETAAFTVGEALWRAGFQLYQADTVAPALDAPLTSALTIHIRRARPIMLQADGNFRPTRTVRATVGEVLSDSSVVLVGEDYSIPAPDQPLPVDGLIRVVRVREEILETQDLLPFETVYQARADWEIDTVAPLQAGANGLRIRRVRVRYEDGVEVSRVDEGEVLSIAPTSRVIGYGTNIVIRTLDTPQGPLEYWRAYEMYATSYAAKFLSRPPTSPNYGRTASGKILTKGLVAIDRRYVSFGTRMYVPGYGPAEAADTGGGVKGRWIDLGFDDWNYESWHRVVRVYFLTPVPPPDRIVWIIPSTVP